MTVNVRPVTFLRASPRVVAGVMAKPELFRCSSTRRRPAMTRSTTA